LFKKLADLEGETTTKTKRGGTILAAGATAVREPKRLATMPQGAAASVGDVGKKYMEKREVATMPKTESDGRREVERKQKDWNQSLLCTDKMGRRGRRKATREGGGNKKMR